MNLRLLTVLSVAGLVAAVIPAAAAQQDFSSTGLDTPGPSRVLELPDVAGGHAVPLGTAFDPGTGLLVEGYAIFHHRPGHDGGPGGGGSPGGGDEDTSSCFALISKGASWGTAEPWIVNTANGEGLSQSFDVLDNLSSDLDKWESAANSNIFGNGSTTTDLLEADYVSPDGLNEVYFGDIGDISNGAIAVAIVWGVFSGPPPFRSIVEWDMVFNNSDFDWSSSGEAGKMDFENIATHETGHAAGLGHPSDSCTEETMYRFAANGETKKRDLNDGDIAGINKLY